MFLFFLYICKFMKIISQKNKSNGENNFKNLLVCYFKSKSG
jgi:hypothetical protein